MQITKFVHSCLLVETPERTALFNPGVMSADALNLDAITKLDDILITHIHPDHYSPDLIKKVLTKFPNAKITSTTEVKNDLKQHDIEAFDQPSEGIEFFEAPHESVAPFYPQPEQHGIHYLGKLSDPGDSHSFHETKEILALPITAPWGSTIRAVNIALELKPKYVLPIHDWHWSDAAREQTYDNYEAKLAERGIKFFKLQTGQPIQIDL